MGPGKEQTGNSGQQRCIDENPASALSLAARLKNTVDRTSIFYHPDADEYGGVSLAALLGTFNFDQADSAYTAKYKKLALLSPINKVFGRGAGYHWVHGPRWGNRPAGHRPTHMLISVGKISWSRVSTLTPNVFIDEIHATDWIIARTEEETLALLLNTQAYSFHGRGYGTTRFWRTYRNAASNPGWFDRQRY